MNSIGVFGRRKMSAGGGSLRGEGRRLEASTLHGEAGRQAPACLHARAVASTAEAGGRDSVTLFPSADTVAESYPLLCPFQITSKL